MWGQVTDKWKLSSEGTTYVADLKLSKNPRA